MMAGFLERVLRDFRVTVDGDGAQPDARSGAGVWKARTASGEAAYLKLTASGPAARRELRFYREVAPAAPVRTPPLLDFADEEAGVALLLGAAGSPRDPSAWNPGMWADLGTELAALHSMPLPPDADRIPRPDPDMDQVEAFWSGRLPHLPDRAALVAATSALPPVFTHGDCHTANILHNGGSLIFCDWQSAGIADPAADLAFLSVRATPSGTAVPPALLDSYLAAHRDDPATLRRAVLAEELATLIYEWPAYAALNSPSGITHTIRRTQELMTHWQAEE
jgi:aminoglycoside phosphotransferase